MESILATRMLNASTQWDLILVNVSKDSMEMATLVQVRNRCYTFGVLLHVDNIHEECSTTTPSSMKIVFKAKSEIMARFKATRELGY